jgi:hypothetical protein
VVVRGNHEDCNRGGNGYFIYMDPREGTEKTCAPTHPRSFGASRGGAFH